MIKDTYHGAVRYAALEVKDCMLDDSNDQHTPLVVAKNVSDLPANSKYYVRTVGLARSTVLPVRLEAAPAYIYRDL